MALGLFAMTRLAGYVLYIVAGLYLSLLTYILFEGWRPGDEARRIRLLWFLLLPTALFVALWLCGRWIWMVFVFLTLGVDAPYDQLGRTISAAIAVVAAAIIFVRLARGRAPPRFRAICSLGVAVLAILFSTMQIVEFTSRIRGWSAHGAVENDLARFRAGNSPYVDPSAVKRIVEEPLSIAGPNPTGAPRFVLYYGNSPIREVTVVPYGWWWWTVASSCPAIPFDLDRAVEHWETDPEEATEWLEEVITSYPNSDAARWASDALEGLRAHGRSDVPPWRSEMMRRLQESAKRNRDTRAHDD